MTVAFNKFDCFVADLANKVHNLSADALKVMLTNTVPVRTNTVASNITEIAAGNGYTAGGNAAALTSCAQTGGVLTLVLANPATWTAAGGSVGPFQYAVIYNSTNNALIAWFDYGQAVSMSPPDNFSVQFSSTTGVLTLA